MKESWRKLLAALLVLALTASFCGCTAPAPAETSSEENSPSSQPMPEPVSVPAPAPDPQATEDDGPEDAGEDAADIAEEEDLAADEDADTDLRPDGSQGYSVEELIDWDQTMHWSEEEIRRLLTEIAGGLYLKDEALTGLTPVCWQAGPAEFSYGILVSDTTEGYFAYLNDTGEAVAFRAITCAVTWVESERKYLLDLISVEEWE